MPVLPSACPLDCPDSCSLDVTVDDGRVTKLDGSERNPLTGGFICGKVRRFTQHMYGDDRIRHPMVRDGEKGTGSFRQVSWDEALGRVAAELGAVRKQHGGQSILPYSYGGSNGRLTEGAVDERLWRRLGTSRLLRTFCAAPSTQAAIGLYGRMPGVAFSDYVHAKLIVVWGANPSATGIHHIPIIKDAQARGARLVVVDPRRTPLAKRADLHLPVHPGTDLPLAMTIIDWLFRTDNADHEFLSAHATGAEELARRAADWSIERAARVSGVAAEDIERFAQLYAGTNPAVIRCGWGPERNRNGGSGTAAILAIPAVAGKLGVRGGGFTMSNSGAWSLGTDAVVNAAQTDTRQINMLHLGRALNELDTPPVNALVVYNCNPASTAPRQQEVLRGLRRDNLFTVVIEQVMTDTALYADVLLPATTFLEHREVRNGYGSPALFDAAAVAAPVGEAKPNYEIFAELCQRLGLAEPGDPIGADALADAIFSGAGCDSTRMRGETATNGLAWPPCGPNPIQMIDVLPSTSDQRIHLVPDSLERQAPEMLYGFQTDPATERYPLALISPASGKTVSSTFGQLQPARSAVQIHPDDAAARAVRHGEPVRMWNDFGEVHCAAEVTTDVRPGVVSLPKGLWARHTSNGSTSNALIPDTLADLGGGACFNDARVQIAPASLGP